MLYELHIRTSAQECMVDITVDQVYKVTHELLASSRTEKLFSYSEQR